MPWGAEMGGGCVIAAFLGFGSILHILVAGLGQVGPTLGSWTQGRRDLPSLDVQGDRGPLAMGTIPPCPSLPERWECATLALGIPWHREGI